MKTRTPLSASLLVLGALAAAGVRAQAAEPASPPATPAPAPSDDGLRRTSGMLMLDYQTIRVRGDQPIDFLGFHVQNPITDRVSLSVGAYAPLVRGVYGGFTAFDIGAHVQQPLGERVFATAGLSAGGGGGGRSIEQSKVLSGTGGYYKGYVGLGYDFGDFSAGVNLSRMKFKQSVIDGTQANVFIEIPYSYLAAPFSRHGQAKTAAETRQAQQDGGENMLTAVLDNFHQINPKGTHQGGVNVVDLQYSHFIAPDTYWFGALGVGYHGLPLYNQVLGGIGQRVRLTPALSLYGQLGIGSGGYAPELIDTGPGLLVYPKLSAEYAITQDLGVSLSAGYLVAPKGTSKNFTYGLALTQHLRAGEGGASFQGFRFSVLQQTEFKVRYRDLDRDRMQMVGVQGDVMINRHLYLPLQATVATSAYLGYPGYGELLAGLGVQSQASASHGVQVFGQLMGGTNVHGPAVKASGGVRYDLNDRWSLHLAAGKVVARNSSGKRFSADSVGLGLDYRFAM